MTFKDEFAKVGGTYAFFVSNTGAKYQRAPQLGANAFGLAFWVPDPSEPPSRGLALSGGTLDGERIRFRTERPGHLLIRFRGHLNFGSFDGVFAVYIDGQVAAQANYRDERLSVYHFEWTAPNIAAGDHELVLASFFSGIPEGGEPVYQFHNCTLTVEFAPALP